MNHETIDTFARRLSKAIEHKGISQAQLSRETGIWPSAISDYINGKYEAKQDKVDSLSRVLNVDPAWLMGYDVPMERQRLPENIQPIQRAKRLPILGAIACGEPILAEENFEGYIVIDGSIKADFTLRTIGDSMIEAGIEDGDLAFIRQQASVETGEIAAVYHDGEATLKKVYYTDDSVILQPCNSEYSPLVVKDDVRILGKLVGVYHHVE